MYLHQFSSGQEFHFETHQFDRRLGASDAGQGGAAVVAMATSYNWLFLWDEKHSINGVFLVLVTDKWP